MDTLKFKTNLKCAGCMYAIKPHIEKIKGIKAWDVDLEDTDKTVTVEGDKINPKKIIKAIEKAGYTAEVKN